MDQSRAKITIWVFLFHFLLQQICPGSSETEQVKRSLIRFVNQLSQNSNGIEATDLGWNMSTDPCADKWKGVSCNARLKSVRKVVLESLNLGGTLNARSLCTVKSLSVLSLKNNSIIGQVPEEIGSCKQLTHIYISGNKFSGNLPQSLSQLNNLKRLDISYNNFSGILPDLAQISGLVSFLAEHNELNGTIPAFDFTNFQLFNVSFNNFSGQIPDVKGRFDASCFVGNPYLCGKPLPNACSPSSSPQSSENSSGFSIKNLLLYLGYIAIGVALVVVVAFTLFKRKKAKEVKSEVVTKRLSSEDSINGKIGEDHTSPGCRTGESKSEFSITSVESGMVSSSLVVLSSPVVTGLKLEELLRAPAELVGRGRHGSLYKVIMEGGSKKLAVKRIKDWKISNKEFKLRMQKLDVVKHPNVLPPVAFFCSKEEKLLVYEYQQNGSLCGLLHGAKEGGKFDWVSRLNVSASIAEALAFMHEEFREDGIAHGNLKSSNILFNEKMEPCISEYGLMVVNKSYLGHGNEYTPEEMSPRSVHSLHSAFMIDLYGFGVILLELLTGKLVQNNGAELAKWVRSVVQEEWTTEMFDESLVEEGASEDGMVNLLQVALKCINFSPDDTPNIYEVALMINAIKEGSMSIDLEPHYKRVGLLQELEHDQVQENA